jgi:hypothetical protein
MNGLRRFLRWRLLFGPGLAVLALLCGWLGVRAGWAAPGQPEVAAGARWVPFEAGAPAAEPVLSLVRADGDGLSLLARAPGAWAGQQRAPDQDGLERTFSTLGGAGYVKGAVPGLPDLPVLRRSVEIPFGASVTIELEPVEPVESSLARLGLLEPLLPLQPPRSKCAGGEAQLTARPAASDRQGFYPENPVVIAEEYVVRGHRVAVLEVWPVALNPATGALRLYPEIAFTLRLTHADQALTRAQAERYASPGFESRLAAQLMHFNQGLGARRLLSEPLGYLIITADPYAATLAPFVSLKQSRGFTVTLVTCSEIGGCASTGNVKSYIQNAYDHWPLPPSYLLLVGDTDSIATFTGPVIGTSTDLYYATMDGAADWHPDLGRGRFPVRNTDQLGYIVDRYLAYAGLTGQEAWLKKAAFPATCDNFPVAEGTHDYVIETYTLPAGFSGLFPHDPQPGGDRLYCVTYGADHADLVNSFNDGRLAIVYSGHGSYSGWEMNFTPNDVRNLESNGAYPFVASHACLTGDFGQFEVFGETWVLQEARGALVYWGSSTYSYWDEDDILERAMFDELFVDVAPHANVAAMTDAGLAQMELHYPGSARYYWETYNVLGDPAVRVFMEPDLPAYTLSVNPSSQSVCSVGTVNSQVEISSTLGYSETVGLSLGPTPLGVTATLDLPAAPAPFTTTLRLEVGEAAEQGQSRLDIDAADAYSLTAQAELRLWVVKGDPAPPTLLQPLDGAIHQPLTPTLSWEAVDLADGYRVQLGSSPLFEQPLVSETDLVGSSYHLGTPLEGGRCYWWRAGTANACGEGAWSQPRHFAALVEQSLFSDDLETGDGRWWHSAARGVDHWQLTDGQSHSPAHAWFVPDDPLVTDSRLLISEPITLPPGSSLTFWHRYQFEGAAFDGGVLEISLDGDNWTDLGSAITANGYNTTLNSNYQNPLGGREAWGGDLTSWTQVRVDLSAYAGQAAWLRWRLGCDKSVGDAGWWIDDVALQAPAEPAPTPEIFGMAPAYGKPDETTAVTIFGGPFVSTPALRLGETWLLSVTQVSTGTIAALVPPGLPNGVHTLTLFNGDCQQVELAAAFTVSPDFDEPISGLTLANDGPTELGSLTTFTASLTAGKNVTYTWDFGDGGKFKVGGAELAQHLYIEPGLFTATLTATNSTSSAVVTSLVQVLDVPIAGLWLETSGPAEVGSALAFNAAVQSGTNVTYSWDFGDGTPLASGAQVSHVYQAPGDYLVTVTASNSAGNASQQVLLSIRQFWRFFAPVVASRSALDG